jgi:hypothetical protein
MTLVFSRVLSLCLDGIGSNPEVCRLLGIFPREEIRSYGLGFLLIMCQDKDFFHTEDHW